MEVSLQQFSQHYKNKSQAFQKVLAATAKLLSESSEAQICRDYLNSRFPTPIPSSFQFGYFPSQSHLDSLYSLIPRELLLKLGLIYSNFNSGLDLPILNQHNLIFPYQDLYGNFIGLGGRSLLSEEKRKSEEIQKYKYTQFSKLVHLFGLYQAIPSILSTGKVIIVEGQIDCIRCHQTGLTNTIALGCTTLTWYQLWLLKRFTNHLVLLLDNDLEGQKAQDKIYKKYHNFIKITKLILPKGYKDIDLYIKDYTDLTLLTEEGFHAGSYQESQQ